MNSNLNEIINQLKELTLLEASNLVALIESTFGVDTSIISASQTQMNIVPVDIEPVEEKSTFDLMLAEVPSDKKIAILKIVRNITGLGLKESKDIVDNAPKLIKESLSKEECANYTKDLEAAGAKVLIK